MNLKYYEIVDYPKQGINSGNFSGKSPGRAASKVFSKLAKEKGNIKEKKYVGTRIHLVEPTIVQLNNGKKIIYRYKNIVTPFNKYYENNVNNENN